MLPRGELRYGIKEVWVLGSNLVLIPIVLFGVERSSQGSEGKVKKCTAGQEQPKSTTLQCRIEQPSSAFGKLFCLPCTTGSLLSLQFT